MEIDYMHESLLNILAAVSALRDEVFNIYDETQSIYEKFLMETAFRNEYILQRQMENEITNMDTQRNLLSLITDIANQSVIEHDNMVNETDRIISDLRRLARV